MSVAVAFDPNFRFSFPRHRTAERGGDLGVGECSLLDSGGVEIGSDRDVSADFAVDLHGVFDSVGDEHRRVEDRERLVGG